MLKDLRCENKLRGIGAARLIVLQDIKTTGYTLETMEKALETWIVDIFATLEKHRGIFKKVKEVFSSESAIEMNTLIDACQTNVTAFKGV